MNPLLELRRGWRAVGLGWGWVISGICGFCRTGVTVRMDESKGSLCRLVCVWLGEEKGTGLHPYGEGLPRLEGPGVVSCGSRVSPGRGELRPVI